ncbi:MAG: alkaline phosphatase D family protein, partial [Thermomicrobiales bacterium]
EYYYRFMAGDAGSPVGRTKTAPARDAAVDRFAFAYASCQNWEAGYYPAYRHMAQDDLDLVIHLGDYIYESGPRPTAVRFHTGNEIYTLDDYRNRHALYKTDPDLQAAHGAFPWLFTWDDHEVDNNWASDLDQDGSTPVDFLPRRTVGFQAYYEHLPLRPEHAPRGDDLLLYRRFTFGNLAAFNVLDTRQYRSNQACDDGFKVPCAETLEEERTMTGPDQERWLLDGLDASTATWNVIAQQTIMASFDYDPTDAELFNHDQWDGYPAARNRILGHIMQTRPANPVVITGDWHSSWVNDLKADFRDVESETLATEFVGTSISSGYPGDIQQAEKALAANPHVKFFNGDLRGYVRATLTPDQWQADYQLLDSVRTRDAPIQTRASFIVETGRPGAERL